jgi:hypothetical protein
VTENPYIVPDYFDEQVRCMWFTGQGRVFHTHGEGAGEEGVWNGQGQVKGIFYSPIQTSYKTGAFQEGSTLKSVKWLHRDLMMGFHITETQDRRMEDNESDFLGIFEYEPDQWDDKPEPTTLHIDTIKSGERRLDVMMHDAPDLESDVDPLEQQYLNPILKLRAAQPHWYQPDHRTKFSGGQGSASGFIEVSNPTDRPMKIKWILTRGQWNIPDFSWKGAKYSRRPGGVYKDRIISLQPITDVQGGAVISLDTANDLMVRDHNYTNALPTLLPNGQHFIHQIPPYTPKTLLPISYTGAPAGGAMATLVQPRRWTAPWGRD